MIDTGIEKSGWLERKNRARAIRALERQRAYQEQKAVGMSGTDEFRRQLFIRSQAVRQKLHAVRPIAETDRVLEVGSGAHGLIFGFGGNLAIGIDPLAADYKRLFPDWQQNALTAAAEGERLPFEDSSFEIVLSDNVIDHAKDPVGIVHEIVRVLKPGGAMYFTVNIHHPIYGLLSRAHGIWNGLGLKLELSPFADHTVHFSEDQIRRVFAELPVRPVSQNSTAAETRKAQRNVSSLHPEALFKKLFFKNALFEAVAVKD